VIGADLRTAVLNDTERVPRIGVTQEMLNESNMALDLSQERYKIGLSGIVELTRRNLHRRSRDRLCECPLRLSNRWRWYVPDRSVAFVKFPVSYSARLDSHSSGTVLCAVSVTVLIILILRLVSRRERPCQ